MTKCKNFEINDVRNYIINNYINKGKSFVKFNLKNPKCYELMKSYCQSIGGYDFNISRLVWHTVNRMPDKIPICENEFCENSTKWISKEYRSYCSKKCSNSCKNKKDKVNESWLKNHGAPLGKSKSIRNKIHKTNKEKYGGKSPFSSRNTIDKAKSTFQEKYGVESPMCCEEIKNKRANTCLKKYGSESPLGNEGIRNKIEKTFKEKYNGHPMRDSKIKHKFTDSMVKKFGVQHFQQNNIKEESLNKLSNYNWLKKIHHEKKKSPTEIADDLEVDITTVIRYLKRHNIEQKYYNISRDQKRIYEFLLSQDVNVEYNNRSIIYPNELDLYLPEYNFAIEYCGLYWHCELNKNLSYHRDKWQMAKNKNIKLLTIFEDEWKENEELVKEMILYKIGKSKKQKIYARKTNLKEINSKDANNFLHQHHIQGKTRASKYYGLYYSDKLVSVISFKKIKDEYELSRFATSQIVVGGFSKLLKYFVKNVSDKIFTFADLRWSEGDLYFNNNFIKIKELKQDYYFIKRDKRYHKFNFRNSVVKSKIEKFDENKSILENCHNNDFYRLYDCGKFKFMYNGDQVNV